MTTETKSQRSSLETYHLKQEVKELAQRRSHIDSTTLVTLYIPPNTMLSDITSRLTDEIGTASSIKDKNTSKAVQEALRSILARMQYLKNGENGLAIFAGVTEQAGKMEYHVIDNSPQPIAKKDYVCDKRFHVEHLYEMLEDKEQLGIIVIDRGGATFATIRGNHLNILADRDSFVPGKHGRGGQSAGRIERGIEILAQEWFSKMARLANQLFLEEHEISALVIGGPAMSKDQFIEHPTLDYRLREKIFKVYDVGYTGEPGVRDLLSRAADDLDEYALIREKKLINRFLEELGQDTDKAIYGEEPIKKAFKMSAVETLLFSDGIERIHVKIECSSCNKQFLEVVKEHNIPDLENKLTSTKCPSCDSENTLSIVEKQYLIEEFETLASETGAEIQIIGSDHDDGLMLLRTFGGIAALLRFPLDLSTL